MSDLDKEFQPGLTASNDFGVAASQPWVEEASVNSVSEPACIVGYKRYEGEKVPVDERYLGTKYVDEGSGDFDSKLYYEGWKWSGITYSQPEAIGDREAITRDVSFQAEAGLHNYYGPDGTYYESNSDHPMIETTVGSFFGVEGVLYDSRYTNWTESYEVAIDDPATCISIRNETEKELPTFNTTNYFVGNWAPGVGSDEYAKTVWAHTGVTGNLDKLGSGNVEGVTIVDRETRIAQDIESGQLDKTPSEDLPSFFKP